MTGAVVAQAELLARLLAAVPAKTADAIVKENATARIDGLRASLSGLAVMALIALFLSRRIPTPAARSSARARAPTLIAGSGARTVPAVPAGRLPR